MNSPLSGSSIKSNANDQRVGTQSVLAEGPRATKGTIGLRVSVLVGRVFSSTTWQCSLLAIEGFPGDAVQGCGIPGRRAWSTACFYRGGTPSNVLVGVGYGLKGTVFAGVGISKQSHRHRTEVLCSAPRDSERRKAIRGR
jgi:hypothetical protein